MSANKVYEDICYTKIKTKIERVKFVWKIKNFSSIMGTVSSAVFPSSAPENIGKWILYLSRKSKYITIEIKQQRLAVDSVNVKLLLINDKGAIVKNDVIKYSITRTIYGKVHPECIVNLPNHDYLLDKANGLLPNDELIIVCKIIINFPPEIHSHILVPRENRSLPKRDPPPCRLSEDLGNILSSKSLSDVTFVVASHELRAHKVVLAARSPVFADMFSNQMLEKETNVVEIADMDAEVFQAMLEFIYTGKEISPTSRTHDLLAAATKYQLERLKFMCEAALCKDLSWRSWFLFPFTKLTHLKNN